MEAGMSDQLIGVGIIGYGGFGPFVHEAWNSAPGVEVRAVADSNSARIPEGNLRFTTRWKDLLEDDSIDLIAVITPPSMHADMGLSVLNAGKHLLVDKPIATSFEDATRLIEARDRTGKVAAVNFMLRFNPLIQKLANLAHSGLLGQLRHVAVENVAQDDTLPPDHWFWDPEVSGGILVEHAGHFLDVVDFVAGESPTHVQGACRKRNPNQEDQLLAVALYESGIVATHYHEFSRPRQLETTTLRFVFDLAQIDIDGWIPLSGTMRALADEELFEAISTLPNAEFLDVKTMEQTTVQSAGRSYAVDCEVGAHFQLTDPKPDVYQACLCAMIGDVRDAILSDAHRLHAPLETGLQALKSAIEAQAFARSL
jgi:predicted dehydrogenase